MTDYQRHASLMVFSVLALLLGSMAALLLHHNFAADTAQYNWVSLRAILDADSLRLENLGFDQPHGPLLILLPFYLIPWLQPVAPFIASVAVTSLLMTLWYRQLRQGGYSLSQRLGLMLLMVVNPAVLWSSTAGGGEALALLMFYLLYRSCLRMIYDRDIRSFIALGLVLAAFFYVNVISIYLFFALLPLLILIVPIQQLRESPLSAYIIIGMPLMIAVGSWIYFNWIFLGEPLAFLNTYNSAFIGAKSYAENLPWLRDFGGELFTPMMIGLAYVAIGYPVVLFLMWLSYKEGRQMKITMVLMLHPVVSIGIATYTFFLASPLQITTLITASVMAEIGQLGCQKKGCVIPLIALLMIGNSAGWYMFMRDEYSHAKPWTAALVDTQARQHVGEEKLGHWLAQNRVPTLLDMRSGFRVIASRGDAKNLILPFTHAYHLAMRSDQPSVEQIAVPSPDGVTGRHDEINLRYPQLYESGMAGYERIYDENGWRVYRRKN